MQLSYRDVHWLFVTPWALSPGNWCLLNEPHTNDVWLLLRLWSGSRLPAAPIAHVLHVRSSCFFPHTQRAIVLWRLRVKSDSVDYIDRAPDRVLRSSTPPFN